MALRLKPFIALYLKLHINTTELIKPLGGEGMGKSNVHGRTLKATVESAQSLKP